MFYWCGFQPNSLVLGASYPFLLQDTFSSTIRGAGADRPFPQPLPSVSCRSLTEARQHWLEGLFPLKMLKEQPQSTGAKLV